MIRLPAVLAALALIAASPALAAEPPAADRPIVIGSAFDMPSRAENETRHITVWLPPSYAQGKERYPVLYLLDGGEQQDFLPIVGLAQLSWLNGVTDEFIVVGVQSGPGLRIRDFTTRSSVAAELKDFPKQGEAPRFRRFLADELKPVIDARYRTSGETGLIGESLAGYFVVDTALREPELFNRYLAISPSLWWDDQSLSRQAAGLLKARPWPRDRSLYLAIANEGSTMQEGMDRLTATLKTGAPEGLAWTYEPFPTEGHNSIYHPAGLKALRWAFPGPEPIK